MTLGGIGISWDDVLKAIPVVAAVLGAFYKFWDSRPRRRAALKADLELLKAAREQNLNCADLEARVQAELSHLAKRREATDRASVIVGSALALVFVVWTVYLARDGFSWWTMVTGFFAFMGASIALAGFAETPRRDASEAGAGNAPPTR